MRFLPFLINFVILPLILGGLIWWFFIYEEEPVKDKLLLTAAEFDDLPGWNEDDLVAFLPAFHKSCAKILKFPKTRSLGAGGLGGTAADWQGICEEALVLPTDNDVIRAFITRQFSPMVVNNNDETEGLFTGYYEASLYGSRVKSEKYATPLYLRPDELVMVHLGRFRDHLKGQRVAGYVKNGELLPFPDRKAIDEGALDNRDLEIVWVDSAVDAFFLHIQGSGRIELDDGSDMRIGYAAQNGHPYYAIGKTLIENEEVPREKMSMQAIRTWLEKHPEKAQSLMQENASYIFFRELKTTGPLGAQGVELTPGRSLAVDRKWLPLGVPVWLETEVFDGPDDKDADPFRRLIMAQDTGGAIRGPVRGDVFWGHGKEAYEKAGAMKSTGRYWILLPKPVAARYMNAASS